VKKSGFFTLLFLLALLVLFYPPGSAGSSAVYLPLAFFAIALFLSARQSRLSSGLDYLGLMPEKGRLPSLIAWGIIAFACCGAFTLLLSSILYSLGFLDTAPVKEKILSLPLLALISSFTLAPLGEEALFRGYLFRKLGWPTQKPMHASAKSPGARLAKTLAGARASFSLPSLSFAGSAWIFGALVSSIVFALLHFSYGSAAEVIVAFSIGMLLCAFTYKTRSLIPAVIAHALFNFFSVALGIICTNFGCPF
jgi:membrane protease YdiL (CAAX protease family)